MDFISLAGRLFTARKEQQTISLNQITQQAKEDWIYAKQYYNMVSEVELIDYAAHRILATERRYMYLLQCARREGVKGDIVYALYVANKSMTV